MANRSPTRVPIGLFVALLALSIQAESSRFKVSRTQLDLVHPFNIDQAIVDADKASHKADFYPRAFSIAPLDSTNFSKSIHCEWEWSSNCSAVVVHFYSNTSAHDTYNALVYKAVSTLTRDWAPMFKLAAVDCDETKNAELCRQHRFEPGVKMSLFRYFKRLSRPGDVGQTLVAFGDAAQLAQLYLHDRPQFLNQTGADVRKFLRQVIVLLVGDVHKPYYLHWPHFEWLPKIENLPEFWRTNFGHFNKVMIVSVESSYDFEGFSTFMKASKLATSDVAVRRIIKYDFVTYSSDDTTPEVWEMERDAACGSEGVGSLMSHKDKAWELQFCRPVTTTTLHPEIRRMEENLSEREQVLKRLYEYLRPLAKSAIGDAMRTANQTESEAARVERLHSFIRTFDAKYNNQP